MSDLKNYKPKLVVIVSRFPFPLEKGDKLRAYYQIIELSKNFDITLLAISEHKIKDEFKNKLSNYCSSIYIFKLNKWTIVWNLFLCLFNNKPFQVGYFYSFKNYIKIKQILQSEKPKHIYSQLIRTSEYIKDYHNCPKTIDYMDALSKGIERRISKAPFYLKWIFQSEARRLKIYERSIFDYFENKTIISEQDREIIIHPDKKKILCIPNGIDKSFFIKQLHTNEFDIVFVGNLSYAPNIEAVEFISNEILSNDKSLKCLISGANPSLTVQKICKNNKQIELQGWIEDIRMAYCRAQIFVAPMMIGTGMQNKLLEAMALGIPCITTSLANNAIKAIHGESIYVANSKDEFIEAIKKLKNDPVLLKSIADGGRDFVREKYSWEMVSKPLSDLILSQIENNDPIQ